MLRSGLDIGKVITQRVKWDRFEEGFEAMRPGKAILDF
jgi:Zn-dependent alcohol dehydrogenase